MSHLTMYLEWYIIFLLLLQLAVDAFKDKGNYFCDFKCKNLHTVCRRNTCRPSTKCGRDIKASLDNRERDLLLHIHNKLRNIIATGLDTRNGNAEAANMLALSYSKELEFVAQCWANACEFAHDFCRATKKFEYVGQNLYEKYGNMDYKGEEYLKLAVQSWYDQIENVDAQLIANYSDKMALYHSEFTQLVWAKTTHIGCGTLARSRFHTNFVIVICNYGPMGNNFKESVYEKGKPCSKCPSKVTCNKYYPGLCGKNRTYEDDNWDPPFKMGVIRQKSMVTLISFLLLVTSQIY